MPMHMNDKKKQVRHFDLIIEWQNDLKKTIADTKKCLDKARNLAKFVDNANYPKWTDGKVSELALASAAKSAPTDYDSDHNLPAGHTSDIALDTSEMFIDLSDNDDDSNAPPNPLPQNNLFDDIPNSPHSPPIDED